MSRLESWLMHLSTIVLTITGLAYAWMRYMMKPSDPFSVVNHPWEPFMIDIHIIVAPVLILGFGIIFHSHILFKKEAGARTARKSGLMLIPTFAVMALSGYLLQVVTSDFRKALVVLHLGSGAIWALLYLGHQVSSLAQRRSRSNGNRYRVPVQALLLALCLASAAGAMAEPFERNVHSMGTTLRLVLMEQNHAKAMEDSEALIQTIESVDRQLSTWKSSSELSAFNRAPAGIPVKVSPDLFQLLQHMQEFTGRTGGTFDPGIGRLIQIWDLHGKFRVPKKNEIDAALEQSGIRHLRFDPQRRSILKFKDVWIDPGAFGKGDALDRALHVASMRKMPPLLLDFGGQIAVHGTPENQTGWNIRLSQSDDRARTTDHELFLRAGSVSTSGHSERSTKVGDRMVHHILNPITGQPADPFGSVTVWNSSALVADVLSTALYVMGPETGYEWAVKNKIAAAFLMDQELKQTPEFLRLYKSKITTETTEFTEKRKCKTPCSP